MTKFLKSFPRHLLTYAIYNDIVNQQNRSYYFTAGRTQQWDNGPLDPPAETEKVTDVNSMRTNMIVGVKLKPADVSFMIPKNIWTYGTVYTNFSDDTHATPYFVVNSTNDIYKVVSNNNGAASTTEPTSRTTNATFRTSDGYIWKYISTITTAQLEKFGTTDKIPLIANASVTSGATAGTVDAVSVVSVGTLYTKSASGNVVAQISNTIVRVSGTTDEGTDYYANTYFYVSSGQGAGTLSVVASSLNNSSGSFLEVSNTVNVDSTSTFIISPRVTITGDGNGALAYASIADNGIANVTVVTPGTGYTYANVSIPDTSGIRANCKAHVSPLNGHGSNVYEELMVTSIALNSEFLIGMSNTFPNDITFYQFGLLESPRTLANAVANSNTLIMSVKFNPGDGSTVFTEGETIRGNASGATGRVFKSNTTSTYLNYVSAPFIEDEIIVGLTSGLTTSANNVTSHDYKINSGTILFYTNQTAINRSDTTVSEKVRCVFDLEG